MFINPTKYSSLYYCYKHTDDSSTESTKRVFTWLSKGNNVFIEQPPHFTNPKFPNHVVILNVLAMILNKLPGYGLNGS